MLLAEVWFAEEDGDGDLVAELGRLRLRLMEGIAFT